MRRAAAVAVLAFLAGCGGLEPAGEGVTVRELTELERSLWNRTEQLTAECMREQGFEYVPRDYHGPELAEVSGSPFDMGLTRDEAVRSGFGIVDGLLAGPDGTPSGPPEQGEELGGAAREAWDVALRGGGSEETPGCRARGEAQAKEELAGDVQRVEGRLVTIGERIEADPRYQQMWSQWSRCMAEEGVQARDMTELTRRLAREARQLLLSEPAAPPQPDSTPEAEAERRPSSPDPEVVAELRAQEVRAATAAVDCMEPVRDLYEQIVRDVERSGGA